MDTPTARVIAQPRILSFLHILTFSSFFSPFSWNFSFVALHLFPRFSVFLGETLSFTDKESGEKEANREWNEKRCISDPENRILIFFFSFENSHFPRIDRDWVKVMLEVGEMDVCRDFFCARICSSPYVVFFLFFYYFFFGGYFILVSTCRRWRKLKFRSDEKLGRPSERFYLFGWP